MSVRAACALVGLAFALIAPGATARPGAAASYLIFTSNRDGDGDAYATDPAGHRLASLTADSQEELNVLPSPDGKHLAFRRAERGNLILYVADGSGRHAKSVAEGIPVAWSRDGSLLAFLAGGGSSGEPRGISLVGADGSAVRPLVSGNGSFAEVEGWAADGRELAFTLQAFDPETGEMKDELRTVDLAGTQRLVYSQSGEQWFSASWSPEGERLAYRRQGEVAVFDAVSGTTSVAGSADSVGGPTWSPDGGKLIYSAFRPPGRYSLDVADLAAGTAAQLVPTAAIEYEPTPSYSWSPRGDQVVWLDTAGLFDVRADGTGKRRLRRAPWIGWPPGLGKATWSPDGTRLAFEEDGLRTIRPDGTGLKTLATRGSIELLAWVSGSVPTAARTAAALPPLERASRRLLRSRGRITELVAAGPTAGVVSGKSVLDCTHVLAWTPKAGALARASRPVPCGRVPQPLIGPVGGLDIDGGALAWSSNWSCGNTECDRVVYEGVLRRPRRLDVDRRLVVVPFDGPPPKLPCVVCPEPNPVRRRPDVVHGRASVYVSGRTIVVRVHGRASPRLLRPSAHGPVFARLTRAGLFYAYSLARGAYRGHVVFVPLNELR